MVGRFWPLLVIAFFVGSLFRLYTETGIGFYRMFGTLGIVVLGAVASRIVVTAQLGEGERFIRDAVAQLPPECDVWRLGRTGADRIVSGPAGTVVLVTSHIAHYARGFGLIRSLERLAARVERAVAVVTEDLLPEGDSSNEAAETTEPHTAVVFLRREARDQEREWLAARKIDVVHLDDVADYLVAKTVTGEPEADRVPWVEDEEAADSAGEEAEAAAEVLHQRTKGPA